MGDESHGMYLDSRRRALGLARAPELAEQKRQLERVSHRIAAAICAFMRERDGQTFHADDLRQAVTRACGQVAPGSADRVLRDLRLRGVVSYSVVNRAQSLYRAGVHSQHGD